MSILEKKDNRRFQIMYRRAGMDFVNLDGAVTALEHRFLTELGVYDIPWSGGHYLVFKYSNREYEGDFIPWILD